MARHTSRHAARRTWLGGFAVCLIVAFSGYLLVTNVRVNRTATVTSDTADLVEQRVEHVDQLQKDITDLSAQINTLKDFANNSGSSEQPSGTSDPKPSDTEDAGSGTILPAVHGPGITVTLNDSPLWENMVDSSGSAANINDYVVHQEDVEAVVNALWAGGAESMMIMDQRVLFNSAVICQGNVLLLQGKKYSPPFTVSAIGPTDAMIRALDDSNAVKLYKEYVSAFGLGWKVEKKDDLVFGQSAGDAQPLRYASVVKDGARNEAFAQLSTDSRRFSGFRGAAPAEPEYAGEVTMALPPVPMPDPNARRGLAQPAAKRSVLWSVLGILGEVLMTLAAVCALYVVWQMWRTGVQSEHTQVETRQSASWSDPAGGDSSKVAKAQSGEVPVQPTSASDGELIAQVYVPRFGQGWCVTWSKARTRPNCRCMVWNIIPLSGQPGSVGNFAVAGHRNGYGRPLGDVDLLQEGDAIIVRTKDYWYVYKYTTYKIVTPEHSEVIAANPEDLTRLPASA